MSRIRSKLTFANVTSMIALLVALSGSAFAVATVTSADIVNNQVKSVDVRNDDLKGGGLVGKDIKESALGKVPNADKLNGKDITSWRVSEIQVAGPLPIERTFTSEGGMLYFNIGGSGFRPDSSITAGTIAATVSVEEKGLAVLQTYTNEEGSHKAFVPEVAVHRLPAGDHTLRIQALNRDECGESDSPDDPCTATDNNDVFEIGILELPR